MGKYVVLVTSDPTTTMLISSLSKMFHLYQMVVQIPKDRCQALPHVLYGVEIASCSWGAGSPFGHHCSLWEAGWQKQGVRKTGCVCQRSFLPEATSKTGFLKEK